MKVALIGDSHSQVTFDVLIPILQQAGHEIVGRVSKAGWATYTFNENPLVRDEPLKNDPDAVIVSLGGNNHRTNDSTYSEVISKFLSSVKGKNRKIIWLGPLVALREDVDSRHRWTTDWLDNNLPKDVQFIDLRPYSKTGHGTDQVHFTRSAYTQMMQDIQKRILSSISLPPQLYYVKRKLPVILSISALSLLGWAIWRRYGNT